MPSQNRQLITKGATTMYLTCSTGLSLRLFYILGFFSDCMDLCQSSHRKQHLAVLVQTSVVLFYKLCLRDKVKESGSSYISYISRYTVLLRYVFICKSEQAKEPEDCQSSNNVLKVSVLHDFF